MPIPTTTRRTAAHDAAIARLANAAASATDAVARLTDFTREVLAAGHDALQAEPATMRRTVGAKELSKILGISTASVYAAARNGEIPSHQIGDRLLFVIDEVLDATKKAPSEQRSDN